MEEKAKQIAELLKVLANENRLMILCALMKQPMTVGGIAKYVPNITQSALSQHLTLLKAHGILDFHKSGQNVTYSIADHRVEQVINVLQKYYCDLEDKMKLTINKEKCPQNHKCPSMAVCPTGAITQRDIYSLPEIDSDLCIVCGKCIVFCPKKAIEKVWQV